jgi:hypothetical protein
MTAVPAPAPSVTRSLFEVFSSLPDPRSAIGRRYPLGALFSLIVVALLCGEENPEQISRFAKCHPKLLPALGFRPVSQGRSHERRGKITAPSNDMIARSLTFVDGATLNVYLGRWLGRLLARREMAAVDGKALCGQDDYVLSVYCPALGHVFWQESVGEKENEMSALIRILPELLERLGKVRLFTADAGLCHKEVARILVEERRDYLLQLKAPHLTDVRLARDSFEQITSQPPLAETAEKRGVRGGGKS